MAPGLSFGPFWWCKTSISKCLLFFIKGIFLFTLHHRLNCKCSKYYITVFNLMLFVKSWNVIYVDQNSCINSSAYIPLTLNTSQPWFEKSIVSHRIEHRPDSTIASREALPIELTSAVSQKQAQFTLTLYLRWIYQFHNDCFVFFFCQFMCVHALCPFWIGMLIPNLAITIMHEYGPGSHFSLLMCWASWNDAFIQYVPFWKGTGDYWYNHGMWPIILVYFFTTKTM